MTRAADRMNISRRAMLRAIVTDYAKCECCLERYRQARISS
ncbi:MAG: hypothetical protein WCB86_09585 [Candidatus Dormiibacterota bacterium]